MADDDVTRPPESPWDQGRGPTTPAHPGSAETAVVRAPDASQRYTASREVARGGLGRILEGYDHRLARPVAIKELLVREPSLEQRFLREALITARLQHPAIVPIHDSGRWASGDPYYAMKLVSGRSFDRVIRDAASLEARIALLPIVIAVCEAIAYAHSERVIHRDLKPGNVLVGEFGETVVIDWGLAKVLGEEDDPAPRGDAEHVLRDELTEVGSVMGTPPYMAPEQAAGDALDARADVYALGAILYHVLAGAAPYSTRDGNPLLQVLEGPPRPIVERAPDVPRELAAIAEKAMARDPAARYPTAGELAEDLKRYQTGQLVRTHRYTTGELLRRWLRRHRLTVTVAAALVAVLAVVGVASMVRILAERARAEASANALRLSQARAVLDTDPTATLAWLKTHRIGADSLEPARALALEAVSRGVARRVHPVGLVPLAAVTTARGVVVSARDGTLSLVDLERGSSLLGRSPAWAKFMVRAGAGVVTADSAGEVRVWDLAGGSRALGRMTHPVTALVAIGDDRVVTTSLDGTVRVWPLGGTAPLVLEVHPGGIRGSAVAPDGSWIVTSARDGVRLTSLAPGASARPLGVDDLDATLQPTPAGDAVIVGTTEGKVNVVPLDGTAPRELGDLGRQVGDLAVSARGKVAVAPAKGGAVQLFDLGGGPARQLHGHEGNVYLSFSPDGRWLCTFGDDGTARLWADDGSDARVLRGHVGPLRACLFAGARVVTLGDTLRVWDLPDERVRVLAGDGGRVTGLVFAAGGGAIAASSAAGGVFAWDPATGTGGLLDRHAVESRGLAITADGRAIVSGGGDGHVFVNERGRARRETVEGHASSVISVAWRPDGRAFASGDRDGVIRVWDTATLEGKELGRGGGWVMRMAFSPDGARLVAASERLLLFEDGKERVLEGHTDDVVRLAFRADGALATGSADRTARIWDLGAGTSRVFAEHEDRVFDVAFAPDGRSLATSSMDGAVRVFGLNAAATRVLRHGGEVYDVSWSPDGRRLASASTDGTVRVWDLATGAARVLRHPTPVKRVAFSPDGAILASAGDDGVVRLWDEAAPRSLDDAAAVARYLAEATSAVLGPDERAASPRR